MFEIRCRFFNKREPGLSLKLFFFTILLTTVFTLIFSAYQLIYNYNKSIKDLEKNIEFIELSYIPAITNSLYEANDEQLRLLLIGILKLQDFVYVEIREKTESGDNIIIEGDPEKERDIIRGFDLVYKKSSDLDFFLGTITVAASFKDIYRRLWDGFWVIMVSQTIEIFLLGFFIFIMVQILITRHLMTLAKHASGINMMSLDKTLALRRKAPKYQDELDQVVYSFNDLQKRLLKDSEDRKRAEKALEISQKRFSTVLNSIDATIYVADMETHEILFVNKSMIDNFGRDMVGETCWKSLRGKDYPCDECTNNRLVDEDNNPVGVISWEGRNPVNGRLYMNYDRAIEWTDGRLVRLQIATDITEFRKIEEDLRQNQKMEAIGRLAGGVAHDFNNMLSVILGYAEMGLRELDESDPTHERLEEIKKAGERSAALTRQLLAFARKEAVSPQVLDLNKTVDGMIRMLQRLIGEDIRLIWMPGEDIWPVRIDPGQVDQIMANLCVNARDAIANLGRIIIRTEVRRLDDSYCEDHPGFLPGDYVLLGVSDNGCGMNSETIKNIFEPFFTTKERGKGTGLGLAMVYGVVKQNGGFVNVSSRPGRGTSFEIYLPRHSLSKAPDKAGNKINSARLCSETILLVEDDPSILNMTKMMLEGFGYQVFAVSEPEEAIKTARENSGEIHLLLSDVVMPEMNGPDLAEAVLSINSKVKVLFMSGYTANIIARRGVIGEDINYIQKPFSMGQLGVKVRKVLDED